MASQGISTPNKTGIYRLILLIKNKDNGYRVYPGPIIVIKNDQTNLKNILTSFYSPNE